MSPKKERPEFKKEEVAKPSRTSTLTGQVAHLSRESTDAPTETEAQWQPQREPEQKYFKVSQEDEDPTLSNSSDERVQRIQTAIAAIKKEEGRLESLIARSGSKEDKELWTQRLMLLKGFTSKEGELLDSPISKIQKELEKLRNEMPRTDMFASFRDSTGKKNIDVILDNLKKGPGK